MMRELKSDLQELLDWLRNDVPEDKPEEHEKHFRFCGALLAAIDEIDFYREREEILKAQGHEKILEKAGASWYQTKIARWNEILGIGYEPEGENAHK